MKNNLFWKNRKEKMWFINILYSKMKDKKRGKYKFYKFKHIVKIEHESLSTNSLREFLISY